MSFLRSAKIGLCFGAGLGLLYGILFVILKAEDYALLMGSGLLFSCLALIMIVTRNVDWSKFGVSEEIHTPQ